MHCLPASCTKHQLVLYAQATQDFSPSPSLSLSTKESLEVTRKRHNNVLSCNWHSRGIRENIHCCYSHSLYTLSLLWLILSAMSSSPCTVPSSLSLFRRLCDAVYGHTCPTWVRWRNCVPRITVNTAERERESKRSPIDDKVQWMLKMKETSEVEKWCSGLSTVVREREIKQSHVKEQAMGGGEAKYKRTHIWVTWDIFACHLTNHLHRALPLPLSMWLRLSKVTKDTHRNTHKLLEKTIRV